MRKYKIPYAVSNYAKLREEGFYYVDKTQFIEELEQYQAPVFLRPRRFGKSLLCTTLESYYDLNRADQFERLFADTYIGRHPTAAHNQYMVLHLDFSIVPVSDSVSDIERNFGFAVNQAIRGIAGVSYKRYFTEYDDVDTTNPTQILSNILEYVRLHNTPKLYVIIDEYDNFTNQLITSSNDRIYEEVTTGDSFLRTFFKVIKEGIKDNTISNCFITGVLPITMDDLTSGFNIAEMVTLQPRLASMLGFTHAEVDAYLNTVFESYGFDKEVLPEIKQIIESNYNGYRFLPTAEPIYNSTILTYFLKYYTINDAEVPDELIDENVRTDLNWIKRLTLGEENAKEMLHQLVYESTLSYNKADMKSKFNRGQFFQKEFYSISLFYLGMTTIRDNYQMCLPNNTIRTIFIDYYNTLNKIEGIASRYVYIFEQFLKDHSLETLFKGYYKEYLGQFPAQSFDKINENFVRSTFYELCGRYLSSGYTFTIEQNYPSGRCDWEMTGRPNTPSHKEKFIIEFKYFKTKEIRKTKALTEPYPEDRKQVENYAIDMLAEFPFLKIRKYVIYVMANKGYRLWELK